MINIVSEKNIKNGQVISKECLKELLKRDNAKIYEVIRVIDKKPIFLKEHFDRMKNSIKLSNLSGTIDYNNFKNSIELLINENDFVNCNIRVSYYIDDEALTLFYFVKSSYPNDDLFKSGIKAITVKKHRQNPNIKLYESNLRDSIDETLSEKEAFEAILVNDDDTISEGSKSNVFFVKGNKLITSVDSAVLLGVTREKVIEICQKSGIEVEKRSIHIDELSDFDGAFITGTSNNVLPVKILDNIFYDSSNNETVIKTSNLYINEVKQNVTNYM